MVQGNGSVATRTARLALEDVSVSRGRAAVVAEVSLEVAPGSVSVLLGPNGAGKTTLLEAISGVIPASSGRITVDGDDIARLGRPARARLGVAHVEQGRSIFPDLSVRENLLVASPATEVALAYETFPRLEQLAKRRAGLLSGGEQQMLVIARSLIRRPKVLLLDEMSLGLAPTIVRQLLRTVRDLADSGLGILLVEQFATLALGVGDRAYVLSGGRIAYDGGCRELVDDADLLQHLYLGTG